MDRANGGGPGAAASRQERQERFEDEKRRIIESCFNKKDVDGSCKFQLASLLALLYSGLSSLESQAWVELFVLLRQWS